MSQKKITNYNFKLELIPKIKSVLLKIKQAWENQYYTLLNPKVGMLIFHCTDLHNLI